MPDAFKYILSATYYTAPLMYTMQIVACLVSWKNREKFPELRYFFLYPIAGFLQFVVYVISAFLDQKLGINIIESSVNVFCVVEVGLFYYITIRILRNKVHRFILVNSLMLFLIYCAVVWSTTNAFSHDASKIYTFESIAMLLPAYFYFINLFDIPATQNLFDQPMFWINVGLLFTFSCILPLNFLEFITQKYLFANFDLYFINYVCYTVNYIFVVKAYRCKRIDLTPSTYIKLESTGFVNRNN